MANAYNQPYSSLFDIDELMKEEEARKKQLQSAQQKIQRTNVLGEAFRLLTDAIGGSRGATITPRPVNQGIMAASQRFNALEDQSTVSRDRLRLMDIAQREKDLQYGLGLQAEQRQRDWQKDTEQRQATEKQRQDEVNFQQQKQLQGERITADDEARAKQFGYSKALEKVQTEEYNKRYGYGLAASVRKDRTKPLSKTDIPFQVPGTLQKIYLGQEELPEMLHRVIENLKAQGGTTAIMMNPTLRAIERNETVRKEAMIEVIKQYWSIAKNALPDFVNQSAMVSGKPTASFAPETSVPTVMPVKPMQPKQLVDGIFKDAKVIYDKSTSTDQVFNDLRTLINTRYPDYDPAAKAAIYNDLIKRF